VACQVALAPTDARAHLDVDPDGSAYLQIGFARKPIAVAPEWPAFQTEGFVNVGVDIDNMYVLRLVGCLLEKLPNLNLTDMMVLPAFLGMPARIQWLVTVNTGLLQLRGWATLYVSTGAPSQVMLDLTLVEAVSVTANWGGAAGLPISAVDAVQILVKLLVPLAFDLDDLSSLSSLRLALPSAPLVSVELAQALWTLINLMIANLWFALPGVAALVEVLPYLLLAIVEHLLANLADVILGPAKLLSSPVAVPAGVFSAFGKLVPTSVKLEDEALVARGVLDTPLLPWSALPLL
jgi:hypothetical protein